MTTRSKRQAPATTAAPPLEWRQIPARLELLFTGKGPHAYYRQENNTWQTLHPCHAVTCLASEFEHGNSGPGAQQLALALLMEATGDREAALRHYDSFAREIVSQWPPRRMWVAGQKTILAWVEARER